MTASPQSIRDQIAANQAVRAGATPGPWRVGSHYDVHLYAGDLPLGTTGHGYNAALIVADHVSAPRGEAAVLAVLELHAPQRMLDYDGDVVDGCSECGQVWPCVTVRGVVAAWEGAGR